VTVGNQLASLGAAVCKTHAIDHVVHPHFQGLEQVQTGQTGCPPGNTKVAAELPFQDAIHAAGFLLGAQLLAINGFSFLACLDASVLTRGK